MYCYHIRTNPGLEQVLARELTDRVVPSISPLSSPRPSSPSSPAPHRGAHRSALVQPSPEGRAGWTALTTDHAVPPERFSVLRCAYEVVEVLSVGRVPELTTTDRNTALSALDRFLADADLPLPCSGESFAARCYRHGVHSIKRPDVERLTGTHVTHRIRADVNLAAPDVVVRVDLSGDVVVIGRLTTHGPLDRRHRRIYQPRITLSPVVAAACLVEAERPSAITDTATPPLPRGALLDPFCGSGTIPLEAAHTYAPPGAPGGRVIYASDLSLEAVAGTRANAAVNARERQIIVRQADAVHLSRFYADRGVTTVVCNPPFGIRLGRRMNFDHFYRSFLDECAAILPSGGRVALLSARRRGRLNRVLRDRPQWREVSVTLMETGGVYPALFVLELR